MRSEYPFEQKGSFRTPDCPELQTLWDAAAKTIRVCTTDAYTDNYRERRQYAQTTYYACLGNYSVFGDYALQRRYLTQIAEEQLANGIMPAYAPRHGDDFMVILDSNCFWIRGLHQYLLYSGDRRDHAGTAACRPQVARSPAQLHQRRRPDRQPSLPLLAGPCPERPAGRQFLPQRPLSGCARRFRSGSPVVGRTGRRHLPTTGRSGTTDAPRKVVGSRKGNSLPMRSSTENVPISSANTPMPWRWR